MSPIYFIQMQYKNRKMKYCDTKIVFWRKRRKMNSFCVRERERVLKCACVFISVCESSRVDFGKVKAKRKIIGVSWSERRRIQMDLIPSFSFDVSSHHFIVVCFVLSVWCLYPSERVGENTAATQCVIVLVVRLKLYFYSYCFCLDKNILSFGNTHVFNEYVMIFYSLHF